MLQNHVRKISYVTCLPRNRSLAERLQEWIINQDVQASLKWLKIMSPSSPTPLSFSGLGELESLHIYGKDLQVLMPGWLEQAVNLRFLYVESTSIKEITSDSFGSCGNLKFLLLNDNLIESIHPAAFANLANLSFLDLHGNWLTTLPENLFEKTTNLSILDLSDKKLSDLPATTFHRRHSTEDN